MSNRSDTNHGGAYALAGFLYQAIGVGALAAKIHAATDDASDIRLTIESNTTLTHEHFGQDAVMARRGQTENDGERRRTFVQFKYSHDPDIYPCTPAELLEIVKGFRKSHDSAKGESDLPADFVIITNRKLSTEADLLKSNAEQQQFDQNLGTPTQMKAERDVLNRIQVFILSGEALRRQIERYAAALGVLPDEFEDRVNNLVGRVCACVGGSRLLDSDWLSMCITGATGVREVTPASLQSIMQEELRVFAGNASIPKVVTRRELMGEVEKAILEKPIVMLHGSGGKGKTVLQHQVLSARAASGECYIAPVQARALNTANWISRKVQLWRGGSPPIVDEPERAIERLKRARGDGDNPLLVIDIDGLDEQFALFHQFSSYVSQVLDLACKLGANGEPCISVLVSCRSLVDLERVWPNARDQRNNIRQLHISDFTDAELRNVVSNSPLSTELLPRLAANTTDPGTALLSADAESSAMTREMALPQELLSALRHPLLWGCLIELEQPSEVLKGSEEVMARWADAYVTRFTDKDTFGIRSLTN